MPMIYGPMPQMMSFWWPRPFFSGRVGWDLQSSQLVARFFLKTMHFLFHLGFEVPQPCEAQNLNRSTTVVGISHVMQKKTLPCT